MKIPHTPLPAVADSGFGLRGWGRGPLVPHQSIIFLIMFLASNYSEDTILVFLWLATSLGNDIQTQHYLGFYTFMINNAVLGRFCFSVCISCKGQLFGYVVQCDIGYYIRIHIGTNLLRRKIFTKFIIGYIFIIS